MQGIRCFDMSASSDEQASKRDLIKRTLESVISASPIALTAGAAVRIIESQTSSGRTAPITSKQYTLAKKICDELASEHRLASEQRTIEKNGYVISAAHYRKR